MIGEPPSAAIAVPEDRDAKGAAPVENPHAIGWQDLADALKVEPDEGLTDREADERRQRYGPNALQEPPTASALGLFVDQFKSAVVLLLGAAGVVAFAFGETLEAYAIAAVLLINALIGWVTELRAVRSMEALREMTRVTAKARRDGRVRRIAGRDLVPGDVVVLEAGDLVPADLRLVEANQLEADESPLTGESTPVEKTTDPVEADAPVADRGCLVHQGTSVTRGSALGVVVATGTASELGRIAELAAGADEEETVLETRLDVLARKLMLAVLVIGAVVSVAGILRGKEVLLMVETGIALAVAAVPEGLPVVATLALARGMLQMARRNALVNRLASVQTLGSTNVLFVDKTGTLTENRMTVAELHLADGTATVATGEERLTRDGEPVDLDGDALARTALETGVLCNNASLGDDEGDGVGEPMEVALLDAGRAHGLSRAELLEAAPEEREEPFDTDTKMMATMHRDGDGLRVAVKGAPEHVIEAADRVLVADGECELDDDARRRWLSENEAMAQDGMRVLALATGRASSTDEDPYADLALVGLIGFLDPPRADVPGAVAECQRAGLRVIMVTGDHPETARHVARAVGIGGDDPRTMHGRDLGDVEAKTDDERDRLRDVDVFARVAPEQKLTLIELHQAAGNVVAMTGDGVNDAPALSSADIGIAMGKRGTQVAREASDLVLRDDAFTTIVEAIRHGRVIFNNIRRFILYLLSCNVSEVIVVALSAIAGLPLLLLPLQILFLNLVTDVFPALALGLGPGSDRVMDHPPRDPAEPFLRGDHWAAIAGYGGLLSLAVFAAFWVAIGPLARRVEAAVTITFLTLAFSQLWHVFNMRDPGGGVVSNEITRNPYVWGALALCTVTLGAAVYTPVLSDVLGVVDPGAAGWALVASASLAPLLVGQLVKLGAGRWEALNPLARREPTSADR